MKNLKWLLLALFSISTCTTSLLAQRISIRGHGSLHKKQRSINLDVPIIADIDETSKVLSLEFLEYIGEVRVSVTDTNGNIVYEGKLNNLSHEQLLTMFFKFIDLLYRAENIEVIQELLPKQDGSYPKYNYWLRVYKQFCENSVYCFDNIKVEVIQKFTN